MSSSAEMIAPIQTHPPKYWAVLIGIDHYSPERIVNLHGCVQDVNDIEQWIKSHLHVQSDQITKLTASENNVNSSQMPTYDNVVSAVDIMKRDATPGDFVYFHYSGHGARVPAKNPHTKSATRMDEVLVLRGKRPLRDFELGGMLDDLALRGLTVFAVLDCCHSGGAERDTAGVRGVGHIPLLEEAFATNSADALAFDGNTGGEIGGMGITRGATVQDSWWTKARDYTVLAACQPHEKARELRRKGRSNGLLTYSMIESLNLFAETGRPVNYTMLYNDVRARMYAEYHNTLKDLELEFRPQHPMVLGKQNKILFGNRELGGSQTSSIIHVEESRVYIDIGEPHGVACGDQFAIFDRRSPFSLTSTPGEQVSTFTIDRVSGAQSSGVMTTQHPSVAPGCWVKLIASATRHDAVVVMVESDDLLSRLQRLISSDPQNAILRLCSWHQSLSPTYEIHVLHDYYEITLGSGQPISNVLPILITDEDAAERVCKIILALAKYRIVKSLRNDMSYLDGLFGLKVSAGGKPLVSCTASVCDKDKVIVQFQNYSEQTLYYTILNIAPGWIIRQLRPRPGDEPIGIQPGRSSMPLQMTMDMDAADGESNLDEIEDIIKVIVTTEPTQFWMLQSPGLSISSMGEWRGSDGVGSAYNELYRLLKQFGASRSANPDENWDDWQTYDLVIKTKKPDDSTEQEVSPDFVANILNYAKHGELAIEQKCG